MNNLRYSQDANQAATGQVYFTTYDFGYRPLTSGKGTATFSGLDPNSSTPPALETNTANWLTVRAYDAKPSTASFPWSRFSTQIGGVTLANVYGRLAATANKSNGAWQVDLFSYDSDGRVAARYTFTEANGGASVLTALNTTVNYARDLRDSVTVRSATIGAGSWHQWYDYDNRGLLWKVFASTSATKPSTPDVTYTYRPSGKVLTRQFQGGVLDTLRYTIREQLERIGDVNAAVGPFAAKYVYNPDGTVRNAEFRSEGAPTAQKRYVYDHAYDNRKRLIHGQFYNVINGSWSSTDSYLVGGMAYDSAGNLKSLVRYRADATPIDWQTYATASTSNRLNSLSEAYAPSAETWDAEAGAFTYDANGNTLTAPAPYSITAATYDHMNLPIKFTRGGDSTAYRYNAEGQRIAKRVNTGNIQVYILDGRRTLAFYIVNNATGVIVSSHHNILAADRVVGRQVSGVKRYYHTDLLGSTRAVVENGAIVESYDYDPWGVLLDGRTLAGATTEGFTGKERDAETGLDYYGFRNYMPAIGRWTTVDPMADAFPNWSTYIYVLDNPSSYYDELGLCPGIPGTALLTISDCPEGYFEGWGTALGTAIGFDLGAGAGAILGGIGGELSCAGVPICGAAGAIGGAEVVGAAGAVTGAYVGNRLGRLVDRHVQMAKAGKGRGGNRGPNAEVRRIANENNLNAEGRDALHREISGQHYTTDEIRAIAEELGNMPKYVNSPKKPPMD